MTGLLSFVKGCGWADERIKMKKFMSFIIFIIYWSFRRFLVYLPLAFFSGSYQRAPRSKRINNITVTPLIFSSLFKSKFLILEVMFASHLTSSQSPSSSSASLCYPTIFRVRRKRTADPHGALVISLKRAKQMPAVTEPIICFRASTTDLKVFIWIHACLYRNLNKMV